MGFAARFASILAVLALATASEVRAQAAPKFKDAAAIKGNIYVMFGKIDTLRFRKWDTPNLQAALKEAAPNATVKIVYANNSLAEQQQQVEQAIADQAIAIIFHCANCSNSGGPLEAAKNAGIPVIAYAGTSQKGPVDYQVGVSYEQIGEDEGKYIDDYLTKNAQSIKPPIRVALMLGDPASTLTLGMTKGLRNTLLDKRTADGSIKIVCEANTINFVPSTTQTQMEQCLTKTNNGVDAVIVNNDDTGNGAVAALKGQGLENKVKIWTGYDATLDGLRRVIIGQQLTTEAPPYKPYAKTAAQLVVSVLTAVPPPADVPMVMNNNGYGLIKTTQLPNFLVTADTIDKVVVGQGLYTKRELCEGVPPSARYCAP